ncbi:P-loop containing nucleoside triphosphate hydrolase protein [Cadophora sp. DSE1049]|nr:P-loop containing nucleoside triphosphate hydrolase protein [Cadophora sp. DSE1049]
MKQENPPDDKFVYLLPMFVKGFNLQRKRWVDLEVDRMSEVVWNKKAFMSLVLANKTKELLQALIVNQLDSEKSTDLIQGKGNGLILLLHGGPGTGKTLTAESVAEIAEKPLYRVTCGDIGTEPDEVEPYLESVLHLGKIWKGVVLLDEADVFLEQRSLDDLRRNALVSIFLRVLEYYDGILVLTSNRVGTFDEAFKSRIQLALHYPKLDQRKRTKVWENFIDRLDDLKEENIDFNDLRDNVEELAKNKMNGREIRNAITLARQYTQWKKTKLNLAELQDIIKISGQFDVYLSDLNSNVTQDQLAQEEGWRLAEADK